MKKYVLACLTALSCHCVFKQSIKLQRGDASSSTSSKENVSVVKDA